MATKPFFSIVIPTYNRAHDLQFALFCIFQQAFTDFEVVISDNNSTDNTQEIVTSLKNKKILYSRTKKTLGNALNMKRAMEMAKGEYIFFHSDDDFLLDEFALEKIYKKILRYKSGFIRLNYVSLSFNKKQIFSYKVNKPFLKDTYEPPNMKNEDIVSFILDCDPYFITGIIFKNSLPKRITLVDSDPVPWIDVLFYSIKKNGGLFLFDIYIIASWSRRKINKNVEHHIFTLIDGKLRSEKFFQAVKEKVNKKYYEKFLHNQLILLYVSLLPAIKFNIGNKRMIGMSKRICKIDKTMLGSVAFWSYLAPSLILPRLFLRVLRDTYLYLYTRLASLDNNKTSRALINLDKEFAKSLKR